MWLFVSCKTPVISMQTPVKIDFQGMDAKPRRPQQNRQAPHPARGSATAGSLPAEWCSRRQVTITTRTAYTRSASGSALPEGREVNISHTAQNDERHSDLTFAIDDAFHRARRQLQDQARKLQGQVKHHDGRADRGLIVIHTKGSIWRSPAHAELCRSRRRPFKRPLLAPSGQSDRTHVCPLLDNSEQRRILARQMVCPLLTQSGHA